MQKVNSTVPLIFIGQLEDSEYSRALFVWHSPDERVSFFSDRAGSTFRDYFVLREEFLLSTSTFAWLASLGISENNDLILLT